MKLRSIILGLLLALASPLAAFAQCSGQAPATTYCGNPTGALALPGWKPFSGIPFPSIAGGTVVGNRATGSATASAITNPILGIPGTSTGQLGLAGATSGTVTILPQAAAGTYNFNLPTGAGTAGQPLLSGGGGSSPMTFGTLSAAAGGTGFSSYTLGDVLYADTTTTLAKLAGNTTTAKQYLSQTGTGAVSAAPAWATISGSDITGAALTKVDDTNVTLTLGGTPTTALLRAASLTLGWSGTLAATRGGTGTASYTVGDLLYADTTTTLAKLAGVATGNSLISGGVGVAPLWGKITSAHLNITTTSCTNQFVSAISAGGVGTCSTVSASQLGGLGTGVATALGVNIGTAGAFVVNGGALGSPSSAGTMPAFTLGGTISGGGNQINNVIIGTSTPLAGFFTALTVSGSSVPTNGMYLPAANTLGFSTASGQRLVIDASGNLGLGLSTPSTYNYGTFVFAVGSTSAGQFGAQGLVGSQTSDGPVGSFQFNNDAIGGAERRIGQIRVDRSGANNSGLMRFYTWNAGTAVSNMEISATGVVSHLANIASTSSTTGTATVTGGLGVSGAGWFGTYVATGVVAVASLPACGAGIKGARMFVNNATATTFASTVAGGGANNVPVVCDGTNWIIG